MKIFLDLDCPLANWERAALRIFDQPNFKITRYDFWHDWAMQNNTFWEKIHSCPTFWEDIYPQPWMEDLISLVGMYDPEYMILTSPYNDPACYHGKQRWIHRHLGIDVPKRAIFTSAKHLLSGDGRILIDDNEKHVREWMNAGGMGILFPSKTNSNRLLVGDELTMIESTLQLFKGMGI